MKTLPQVTDEEINGFMDFEALLKQKNKVDRDQRNIRNVRNLFIGFAGLVMITVTLFVVTKNDGQQIDRQSDVTPSPPRSQLHAIADTLDAELQPGQNTEASEPAKQNQHTTQNTEKPGKTETKKTQEELKRPAYAQAEPLDGYPILYEYFNKHLVYPVGAVKDSVEGVVNVVFSIDITGKAKNIIIENSLGLLFDKEAIRLVENMPLWKPASYNGKAVPGKISLPITFELKKISNLQ